MIATAAIALLSGACNAALIALVNMALGDARAHAKFLMWSFIAVGLGKIITNFISQAMLADFAQGVIADLRRGLIRKILSVPLRHLEELGGPRILVALTDDVSNITQALLAIPFVLVNLTMLLGGAAYLGWLSWQILAGICVVIVLGAIGYRMIVGSAFYHVNMAREEGDRLYGHFRALIEGVKELKLHRNRRSAFLNKDIQDSTHAYERHNVAAEVRFVAAQNWSHLLYFALIGLILFLLPNITRLSADTMRGFLITTLFLMGPLAGVMTSVSLFSRANVALQKIEKLGISLAHHSTEEFSIERPENESTFERLDLVNVTHSYQHEKDDSHFVLGPINLRFRPGELVFLVGGNGSGKSTLAKIVSGLYVPEGGEIRLDGKIVTDRNRDEFRQLFSAVFSDFFLFDNLLGLDAGNLDEQAREYLEQLHLDHKVKIRDGALSTTALSQGQRKRLALLTAYLEDRPFYLFDEWASDQDPQFKNVFYTQILPELKARGKTVLVISHDDKYFNVADRVIKLDYGKLDVGTPLAEPLRESALRLKG
jgi:putative ATP-binding cassette transporter